MPNKEGKKWQIGILQDTGELGVEYEIPDSYYIFSTFMVSGALDIERLKRAVAETVENNDVFHLEVIINDTEKVLEYCSRKDYVLDYYDYYAENDDVEENEERLKAFLKQAILDGPPSGFSFGFMLFHIDEEDYVFVLEVNHIVLDGTSSNIVFSEIAARYNGTAFPQKDADFTDYLDELVSEAHLKKRQKELAYCEDLLSGYQDFVDWNVPQRQQGITKPALFFDTNEMNALAKKLRSSPFAITVFLFHAALAKAFAVDDTLMFYPLAERDYKYRYTAGLIVEEILSRVRFSADEPLKTQFEAFSKNFYKNMQFARPGKNVDKLPTFCITSMNFAQGSDSLRFGEAEAEMTMEYTFDIAPKSEMNMIIGALMQSDDTTILTMIYEENIVSSDQIDKIGAAFQAAMQLLVEDADTTFAEYVKAD